MRATTLPSDLDHLLDRLQCLGGTDRSARVVTELPGGLTNRNLRVTTADRDVVVRISRKDSAMLAIDREAEYANSRAAAACGASPKVVEYVPEASLLVIEFLPGDTLTAEDVRRDDNLPRIAEVCRRLHCGPRFVNDFDMFDIQRGYLRTVTERGMRLPAGYRDFEPQLQRTRDALRVRAGVTVPCNNDLLAANFIDDGVRLWIIDFEYAGNNDPCFELGNLASESHLSTEALAALVTHYYGRELPDKIARARLLAIVSNYAWTLWAAIQAATSPLDFDFWSWGMDKYDRAVAKFAGSEFEQLLTAVAGPPH
jgi:thiamine kinase-like enzyme